MLDDFRTKQVDPNYVLFVSNKNSRGQTYFEKAFPIFTYAPEYFDDLCQMIGRANR